ncbi:MAG TPA: sigma-70 family RNA polymerase sigma factor [Steroidobacteraceae bacterium]|jgi:RNA polymerase sigma-70 factor (ECF subfamily)
MESAAESDEDLMLKFGRGDGAAFETLYRRHESRVFRYLYRHVRNHASANDLMQEVWFAVARSAERYQPTAKFTTWLFTLAHHRMVDSLRKIRPELSLDAVEPEEREESSLANRLAGDPRAEPPAELSSQDEAAALLGAVTALPVEQRTAFLMQAEGELSLADIAEATGSSIETVKSRLRYARAKLRQSLWEYA